MQVILLSLSAMPVVFVAYALVPYENSLPFMFAIAGVGVLNALYFPGSHTFAFVVLLSFSKFRLVFLCWLITIMGCCFLCVVRRNLRSKI